MVDEAESCCEMLLEDRQWLEMKSMMTKTETHAAMQTQVWLAVE